MPEPEDLAPRVAALEAQVRDLAAKVRASSQDAAAARVLAGGADRDVGELRGELRDVRQATVGGFNAMRADLVDLREHVDHGFARIDQRFAQLDAQFAQVFEHVDTNFARVRHLLDMAAAGQQQIVRMLDSVNRKDGTAGPG